MTAPVLSDSSAVYTPGISERRSSTTKFYGTDRLGTNSLETNSSQTVTSTKTYDAFGMLQASTGSSASPFGFAGAHGYQEDGDSGLKLLGHRYYDASTGRFLTRDPIKDGRNWYAYCENNPMQWVDPNGYDDIPVHWPPLPTQIPVKYPGGDGWRTPPTSPPDDPFDLPSFSGKPPKEAKPGDPLTFGGSSSGNPSVGGSATFDDEAHLQGGTFSGTFRGPGWQLGGQVDVDKDGNITGGTVDLKYPGFGLQLGGKPGSNPNGQITVGPFPIGNGQDQIIINLPAHGPVRWGPSFGWKW